MMIMTPMAFCPPTFVGNLVRNLIHCLKRVKNHHLRIPKASITRLKPQPPEGQNKKDPVKMPGSVKHPSYYCKEIVKIPGPLVLIHSGSLSSTPPLSVHTYFISIPQGDFQY